MTPETTPLSHVSRAVPQRNGTRPTLSHFNPPNPLSHPVPQTPGTPPDLHKHLPTKVSHPNPSRDSKSQHVSAGQSLSHPVPYYVGGRGTPPAATPLRPVGPPLSHRCSADEVTP